MPIAPTTYEAPRKLAESYYRFNDILSAAQNYRNVQGGREEYRDKLGKIILGRHLVAVVRDRALMHGFHDNTVVAGALTLLRLPHAEPEAGSFSLKIHPQLFGALKGVRANRRTQGESYAAKLLVHAVDSLTPDARDDQERRLIGEELLDVSGISKEFARLLTPTARISSLDTPELSSHGWQISPYASVDFRPTKA